MKLKTKLIIILFLSTIFLLLSKTEVKAKSYYIDDMNIQATIQSNGDLQIEQTLKYVFNGDRQGVRERATRTILNDLRLELLNMEK